MKLDNFFVGFDNFARNLPTTDYPRYNILRSGDGYELQVALPGWEANQIQVSLHKGVLSIKGEREIDTQAEWIHKGISGKNFERTFKLDTDLEVRNAKFTNGMLILDLQYTFNSKPIEIKVQ